MRSKKYKTTDDFYKELREIQLNKKNENDKLLFYSLRVLKNSNLDSLNLNQINELICVAESSKTNNGQPRISTFISSVALITAFFTFLIRPKVDSGLITEYSLIVFYLILLGCLYFALRLETKRIRKLADITYYLEKLKQAKENKLTHKKRATH
ncbi:hypothetical protein ACTHQ4_10215 [Alkalicoccobacillus gibsonii]|uniref:hypothetical protein n=1 Tax=Alkalicoccobacillus gibsonii TaxID=79881 RepID=UPI003F7C6669